MINPRKDFQSVMNKDISLNKQDAGLKRRLLFIALFIVYPACIINSCIVSPIHTITDSNVAYRVLPLVFYFLGIIIDLFIIFISLATGIYGMYRLPVDKIRSLIILVLLAPVFKNTLKLVMSPIIDGMPTLNNFIVDIYSLAISGLLEVLQLAVVLFIAYKAIKRRNKEIASIPFEKILDLKNPLQFGAFISSAVICGIRVLMWLINDLSSIYSPTINMVFFLPYILEIVGGIIGYGFVLYVFIIISSKEG